MMNAQAQAMPALSEPVLYQQTRSSSFDYDDTTGLLVSETVEPDTPDLCVTTTYSYVETNGKNYGNRTQSQTAPCAGATAAVAFTPRVATLGFTDVVAQPAGTLVGSFATRVANALGHVEVTQVDPRFGVATAQTGPNGLTTSWQLDEFGRKLVEVRADGTTTRMWYCYVSAFILDKTSNTPGCPGSSGATLPAAAPGEQPSLAVTYIHTQSYGKNGAVSGPWGREYQDARGRSIRSVTQAFDGGDGATAGRLIVKDTHYNQNGAVLTTTQPYFLVSGSSTVDGASHGFTYTQYDVLGRAQNVYTAMGAESKPDLVAFSSLDPYSRRVLSQLPGFAGGNFSVVSYSYDGLKTTVTRKQISNGSVRELSDVSWRNPLGKVVLAQDAASAQTAFVYDANDNLVTTLDPLGNRIDVRYDLRGRKVAMQDPNKGYWTYRYNALGELLAQTSPNQRKVGGSTQMTYDALGRLRTRTGIEFTTTYHYDTVNGQVNGVACLNGSLGYSADPGTTNATGTLGKLCGTSTSHGVARASTYDAKLRPVSQVTIANPDGRYVQKTFTQALSYDANFGRVDTQTFPTGVATQLKYTSLGFGQSVANAADPTYEFWRALRINAWGQVEDAQLGHGVRNRTRVDAFTGRVLLAGAGMGADASDASLSVFKHVYVWDSLNNLQSRVDVHGAGLNSAVSETFGYDELSRLTGYSWGSPAFPAETKRVDMAYNAVGNILYKSDAGSYLYPASGQAFPHAVVAVRTRNGGPAYNADYEYDAQGNLTRALGDARYRSINYNSFNLPQGNGTASALVGVSNGGQAAPQYDWAYNESEQRLVEKRTSSRGVRTTWYLHPDGANGLSYEQETDESGATIHRHYINAGGAATALVTTNAAAPTVIAKLEYWHKDHLGSTAALTVAGPDLRSMVKVLRYAYDPWGKRRSPNGVPDSGNTLVADYHDGSIDATNGTDRGFTGHEHLDDMGLIHMNARIYDPMIARFMQADPVIGDPFDVQTYNAYSYVYNRPLNTVDADGRCPVCVVAVFWVAAISYANGEITEQQMRLVFAVVLAYVAGPETLEFTWPAFAQAAAVGYASGAIASGTSKGGTQGALSAALFYSIGQAANELRASAAAANDYETAAVWANNGIGRAALHAAGGCATAVAGGGECGRGALTAGLGKLLSSNVRFDNTAAGLMFASVLGGTLEEIGGGKFANGARMGAFQYIFNALGSKTIKDLFNLKDSRYSGELKGHHQLDEAIVRDFDSVMSPEAVNAASTTRIGQGYVGTGLPGDPHKGYSAEHRAASEALRVQMEDWVVSGRISEKNPMTQKQFYEFLNEAQRNPAVSSFWKSINDFVDLMQSRGYRPQMRGMPRRLGITE
jgi:RHS repeat-associated protein